MLPTDCGARLLAQNGEVSFGKNAGALIPSLPDGVSHSSSRDKSIGGVFCSNLSSCCPKEIDCAQRAA